MVTPTLTQNVQTMVSVSPTYKLQETSPNPPVLPSNPPLPKPSHERTPSFQLSQSNSHKKFMLSPTTNSLGEDYAKTPSIIAGRKHQQTRSIMSHSYDPSFKYTQSIMSFKPETLALQTVQKNQ